MNNRSADHPSATTDLATADFNLPTPRSLHTRTWLSLGMIVLVFLAGAVTGVAGTRAMQRPRELESLDEIPSRVADRMQRDLRLSGDQRDRLEQIARSHQGELRRIRSQFAPELRAEFKRIIDEMSAVLTPEQAERWREKARRRLDSLVPLTDPDRTEPSTP